ncbi:pseudouridine synthase [Paraconexibacter algicola]|uniref:Pseudouridine synthase n=1 Tax=Paraconexibacter algicola TaxID=2133960 RepID=A0A2T4UD69_9ACTN|nr:pseudouridine synthase [Paraconexibacter algicola]PTL55450.1 rRNA pseudouridine synthase [Paraconexibacter algicola]
MRLQKHLAHAGVASRRASEKLVFEGRVMVDGVVVLDPATDVAGTEHITVDGLEIASPTTQARVVYAVNKPAGVVSTARDTHGRPTVVDLVDAHVRLYPVGRLDADTTGLLLLTNDGELAQHLTHPSFEVPKTYRARVEHPPVKEATLRRLREGVRLEDGMTLPAKARALSREEVELTLREGRKRQVRRMLEEVGHPVVALQRVAFGPLRLTGLAEGRARRLTAAEVERLRAAGRPSPPPRG